VANMTMKDIADICGVSLKTVSRVINNSTSVKPETREMVLEIIDEHDFRANMLAKGLRQKYTNTIIFFIDKYKEGYWSIWQNHMLQHLFKKAKMLGYKIVVSPSSQKGYLTDATDGFNLISSQMADGAIILDSVDNDIRIELLNKNKVPYVLMGQKEGKDIHWVDLDNYHTGTEGAKYLIAKGYKNLCFLLGHETFHVNQLRAKGFSDVAKKAGVKHRVVFGIDSMKMAYDKSAEIVEKFDYDALFVSGDERAIGVYRAILQAGLSIPDDIAVLGIDNIALSEFLYPSLSSMDQNADEFAEEVIKMLDRLIKNKDDNEKKQILINNKKIVEREST